MPKKRGSGPLSGFLREILGNSPPRSTGERPGAVEGEVASAEIAGRFVSSEFHNSAGARAFKLYVPRSYSGQTQVPLLVALHGCTQEPDNFAAATRFNELAERHNFIVLYPRQSSRYNLTRCWNWFNQEHQQRGSGEPAIIAGMVDYLAGKFQIDRKRIYAAGISAGGAMTVNLAACYPDYFAAIAVHSGLRYKAANNVTGGFMAMSNGPSSKMVYPEYSGLPENFQMPVIVFQGSQDNTVHPQNAYEVIKQFALANRHADKKHTDIHQAGLYTASHNEQVPGGYSYQVYDYHYKGRILMQQYMIDKMGHAWSGGNPNPPASFADPRGPDASSLIWQFFQENPKP